MAAKLEAITGRVPAELKAELKKLADADKRKLWPYIQIILEDHVAANKATGKKRKG